MKRYFRKRSEADIGSGYIYLEFTGDRATRQAERYGDRWFNSEKKYHDGIGPVLADQPLSEMDLSTDDEISIEEFEAAWVESNRSEVPME